MIFCVFEDYIKAILSTTYMYRQYFALLSRPERTQLGMFVIKGFLGVSCFLV